MGFVFTGHLMELSINGEAVHVPSGLTVLEFLEQRNLKAQEVVVERNLVLVPRDAFAATRLEPGDSLEILHFVGGG
jgi:thiamine biosynthesis protein ThiS